MLVNLNNLGAAVFNKLTTSKSCGNICFFDQHYQPEKITSQVSVITGLHRHGLESILIGDSHLG